MPQPTCAMMMVPFGWLVGEVGHGLNAIAERPAVGIQGLAIGEAANQKAVAYVCERLHGFGRWLAFTCADYRACGTMPALSGTTLLPASRQNGSSRASTVFAQRDAVPQDRSDSRVGSTITIPVDLLPLDEKRGSRHCLRLPAVIKSGPSSG